MSEEFDAGLVDFINLFRHAEDIVRNEHDVIEEYKGIKLGYTANMLLAMRGKPDEIEVVGRDAIGLIVLWKYDDAIYRIEYALKFDPMLPEHIYEGYAVQEITLVEKENGKES